jgi:hypothetical protein
MWGGKMRCSFPCSSKAHRRAMFTPFNAILLFRIVVAEGCLPYAGLSEPDWNLIRVFIGLDKPRTSF